MIKTRQILLALLETNRDVFLSGEALAEQLQLSRAAVWKAVAELRREGHDIEAAAGVGYRLAASSDRLSKEGILAFVQNPALTPDNLQVHQTVGSTNQLAKQLAAEGAAQGTLVVAEEQTAGRGRLGRSFYSPAGTGLYMSILLRPAGTARQAVLTTTATAVAVSRAIQEWSGRRVGIKWVNDLYWQNRKICGILAEAATDMQTGHMESLIVGIGINVFTETTDFPDELQATAGSLFSGSADRPSGSRNQLAALIYDQVLRLASPPDPAGFMDEYRANCFILGQPVDVLRPGQPTETMTALDIDPQGGLVVAAADGTQIVLNSGEVSLKPLFRKD